MEQTLRTSPVASCLLGRCSRQFCTNVDQNACPFSNNTSNRNRLLLSEKNIDGVSWQEMNKTTIDRLVTRFRSTGSTYLWQMLIERRNKLNCAHIDLKQCISSYNGIRLQEFNIATGFVVLCLKGFVSSTKSWFLNWTFCISTFAYSPYF